MADTERVWLSAHVFYHADPDPLLIGSVLPLIDELRREGLVHRAFFLRHWERGPHVRVRLQVDRAEAGLVRDRTERSVTAYLAERPGPSDVDESALSLSLRRMSQLEHGTADPPDAEDIQRPCRPNSVRWIDYRPEYAKYGGPAGVAIAEDVFDASSTLAGNVVRQVGNDRVRLGIALQLLLLCCRALGFDTRQAAVFLRHYHESWAGYLPDRERLLAAWADQYAMQRSSYLAAAEALEAGGSVGAGLGRDWESLLAGAIDRLRPLVLRGDVRPSGVIAGAPPYVALAGIVGQYMHTTNNRMNVRPQGECFVAFLAHRAVCDLLGEEPAPAPTTRRITHVR